MAGNLAEKLELLQSYKSDIEHGFPLKPEGYGTIRDLLKLHRFHLSKEGHPLESGSIYSRKRPLDYEVLVEFNLQTMTHGFSYLRTADLIKFKEVYENRFKAEANRKQFTVDNCTYFSLGAGALLDLPLLLATFTLDLPEWWLIMPPLAGAILGNYLGRKAAEEMKKAEGTAVQNLWKEIRKVKTNWSALEAALS